MPRTKQNDPADYVIPLDINGMQGRMLRLPASIQTRRNKEILLVYGHHSTIERWFGLSKLLSRYGAVTIPDLPGFGGMDSFYKIGKRPTIDNLADYLAAFVKLRYRRKKMVIVGVSFGFVVVTRMLQRYPELVNKVVLLISLDGFTHHDDFALSARSVRFYAWSTRLFSKPFLAALLRHLGLNNVVLRQVYIRLYRRELQAVSAPSVAEAFITTKTALWHSNDVRTHMFTAKELLSFSNCDKGVNLPVWHVAVRTGSLDIYRVEQHMRTVFSDFICLKTQPADPLTYQLADGKAVASLLPPKLKRELAKT